MAYTTEQKEQLSDLFAEALYEFLFEQPSSVRLVGLAEQLHKKMGSLSWFQYGGNEFGILRYLEEEEVYGIFHFHADKRVSLYLHAVYSVKFAGWVKKKRPSKEAFKKAFPKSEAAKPSAELMRGSPASITQRKRADGQAQFSRY